MRADVGNVRKRFSIPEARLVVIAGAAIANGITPQALAGPIGWLREYATYPEAELPPRIEDKSIVATAQICRQLAGSSLQNDAEDPYDQYYVSVASALMRRDGPDFFSSVDDENKIFCNVLNGKHGSEDQKRAQSCMEEAERILKEEPNIVPADQWRKLHEAVNFEAAALGRKDLFLNIKADETNWKTQIDTRPAKLEFEASWLVIDIRQLFLSRGTMS
ncbi:hypothetical protein JT55_10270 [Rhodovulum sp. NI22]|nr:hypothetical protein JT55_10270 [Rhodovulum sp. NI22]